MLEYSACISTADIHPDLPEVSDGKYTPIPLSTFFAPEYLPSIPTPPTPTHTIHNFCAVPYLILVAQGCARIGVSMSVLGRYSNHPANQRSRIQTHLLKPVVRRPRGPEFIKE